jgi:hypothetical protein
VAQPWENRILYVPDTFSSRSPLDCDQFVRRAERSATRISFEGALPGECHGGLRFAYPPTLLGRHCEPPDSSRVRSAVLRKRVYPLKPGKPREVAIRRADRGAVLERDRSEDGVHDERTDSLSVAHNTAQDVPVPFARVENPGGGLAEPGGNRRFGFGCGKRTFEHAGIRCDPEEHPERKPSEANEVRPREHGFEPGPAFLVLLGRRMIRIEQQVRVDEDHR